MNLQELIDKLNRLIVQLEREAIQPFPNHILLTQIALEQGYLVKALKKELF